MRSRSSLQKGKLNAGTDYQHRTVGGHLAVIAEIPQTKEQYRRARYNIDSCLQKQYRPFGLFLVEHWTNQRQYHAHRDGGSEKVQKMVELVKDAHGGGRKRPKVCEATTIL